MSTEDDKNETSRFLGEGVSFKAKLIGILEVSEARGDRMCQEALSDLKMAIRAAGEHKQRITINIAIDGLRLRDEKSGDSLYHHPVHKISFIAQDMSDSRAFGYIFGSPDTGHRFFGIKTDKAASQVVIAMRDLFQVVFALKKKEIELAKQHLDKSRYGSSSLFSDNATSNAKSSSQETTKNASSDGKLSVTTTETRPTPAVADLVDLELELNSLQQGLTQMERITPSDPFGGKDDPFGDSFTSFPQKPMLPPPPSGRERSSRTSESSSLFSPKTPHTAASADSSSTADIFSGSRDLNTPKEFSFNEFNSSHDEPSSGDWFTPPAGNSLFEEPPLVPEPPKDQHEVTKQEILSQFDVFTELDPLGTGKIKPYIDKKHFFQELKNPPKKVLNDLVSENQPSEISLFTTTFEVAEQTNAIKTSVNTSSNNSIYNNDPFGEDPFDTTDPFAEADFKAEIYETEFNDFKYSQSKLNDLTTERFKSTNELTQLFPTSLSKSPKSSMLEKQMSLSNTSPRSAHFNKQNTFDAQFERFDDKKLPKLTQLHENPSLDLSSESECAPDPPPRPTTNFAQIKPPPLPPKKQFGDITIKPPPRPPHTEDFHYEYIDKYETSINVMDYGINLEKSPPLPVPARKSKFESDFVPEIPAKTFNLSQEDDYLTPIDFPIIEKKSLNVHSRYTRNSGPLLLPPPKSTKKHLRETSGTSRYNSTMSSKTSTYVTTASLLDTKPNEKPPSPKNSNSSLDGLDISLSELTISSLNEIATKIDIPASQLKTMTLVQLTTYLSNYLRDTEPPDSGMKEENSNISETSVAFKADFAANFNNVNNTSTVSTSNNDSYDRYAVFRELLKDEIKQTKIDTEPQEIVIAKEMMVEETKEENFNDFPLDFPNNFANDFAVTELKEIDRYAALREIVETEMKFNENKIVEENENDEEDDLNDRDQLEPIDESIAEQNNINDDKNSSIENDLNKTNIKTLDDNKILDDLKNDNEKITLSRDNILDYDSILDNIEVKTVTPIRSPVSKCLKSPIPIAITEIVQTNTRLTSGSLSDVVSGSSPEVDVTGGSASETAVKKTADAAGESWAIFDQPNLGDPDSIKDVKAVQSEEGVSPWSSDSKEFGTGSPPEWRERMDSGSGGYSGGRRSGPRRGDEGWWDTSAEPEAQYYPPNRRSTDSYDDECYDCYDRPRRRRQANWSGQAAGGHSSSSRDVSPWEEEPRRVPRDGRQTWASRHTRQHSIEKYRDRRHTDSWDEEDDYEYEEEHSGRFHWPDRHSNRDSERDRHSVHSGGSRDMERDRHSVGSRDLDWINEWGGDERRGGHPHSGPHRRRREVDRERWCCPDYDMAEQDKPPTRYNSGRWSNPERRKHEDRYYGRDAQESPWEDEYGNAPPEDTQPHYLTARRTRIRPSSASEMDRKTGEIKTRQGLHFLGAGGSDSERDRRYNKGRRSKSRDSQSQYTESTHSRMKPEPALPIRNPHRLKLHQKPQFEQKQYETKSQYDAKSQYEAKSQFENDFSQEVPLKKLENLKEPTKKPPSMTRKKSKESPKSEEAQTFPRKGSARAQSLFENDFVPSPTDSPLSARVGQRFLFENDFETSEAESPTIVKPVKNTRHKSYEGKKINTWFEGDLQRQQKKDIKVSRYKPKSLFEDDFSPTDKTEQIEQMGIPSIQEERGTEGEESSRETDPPEPIICREPVGKDSVNREPINREPISRESINRESMICRESMISRESLSRDTLGSINFDRSNSRKRLSRISARDVNIKKSESVNIFARENDPFDDDFFSANTSNGDVGSRGGRSNELKWTEQFADFDIQRGK